MYKDYEVNWGIKRKLDELVEFRVSLQINVKKSKMGGLISVD